MKAACTVRSGGKSGDNFKGLPIAIRRQVSGHQAAHGWRWCGADRHDPHPSALRSVRLIRQPRRSNHRGGCWKRHSPFTIHQRFKEEIQVWHLSIRQLRFSRRLLSPSAQVLQCGVLSTSWKATATTTPALMLMYSKEANNRKQEIDRQHHTIPNQRANDKHHGNVYNLLFRYGKVRSQNMEKLKSSFPTFCKRTFPQLHKIASYAHYAQCRLLRKPSHFIIYSRK